MSVRVSADNVVEAGTARTVPPSSVHGGWSQHLPPRASAGTWHGDGLRGLPRGPGLVLNGLIGDPLPLALGIAISPIPIIAAILMLLSPKARGTSIGF